MPSMPTAPYPELRTSTLSFQLIASHVDGLVTGEDMKLVDAPKLPYYQGLIPLFI